MSWFRRNLERQWVVCLAVVLLVAAAGAACSKVLKDEPREGAGSGALVEDSSDPKVVAASDEVRSYISSHPDALEYVYEQVALAVKNMPPVCGMPTVQILVEERV